MTYENTGLYICLNYSGLTAQLCKYTYVLCEMEMLPCIFVKFPIVFTESMKVSFFNENC